MLRWWWLFAKRKENKAPEEEYPEKQIVDLFWCISRIFIIFKSNIRSPTKLQEFSILKQAFTIWYFSLLHIMCGYQCDKAMTKNDTREVIWYHFIAVKWYITSQMNCPIIWTVIIWLDQSGCTLYFRWRLAPGVKFSGKNCFAVLSSIWPLQDLWMSPMKIFLSFSRRTKTRTRQEKLPKMWHVICNKQIITSWEPDRL